MGAKRVINNMSQHPPAHLVFDVTVHATALAIREVLATCMVNIARLNVNTDQLADIELVIAETLNNIVEHAYADQPASGIVRISCIYTGCSLFLTFKDSGGPLPQDALSASNQAHDMDNLQTLPEGGFGWRLIQELTDRVSYRRLGRFNRLTLEITVRAT